MRNKPVKDITNFLPTAEVKKSDHFISYGEGSEKFDAKVSANRQKKLRKISIIRAAASYLVPRQSF